MSAKDEFEKVNGDYLEFEKVEDKKSSRPDLHAFILLSELFPNRNSDIVSAAASDEIWLDVTQDQVEKLTAENILELVRCGVRYHDGDLAMFI